MLVKFYDCRSLTAVKPLTYNQAYTWDNQHPGHFADRQPYEQETGLNRLLNGLTIATLLLAVVACNGGTSNNMQPEPTQRNQSGVQPPQFIAHFFDWYNRPSDPINGPNWTYKIDWGKYGITDAEVNRSAKYYDSQFDLLNGLGVDGITYESYRNFDGSLLHPSQIEVDSMKRHNIHVSCFYDWELEHASGKPQLNNPPYIKPQPEIANKVVTDIVELYSYIPKELRMTDRQGRLIIMTFAFGFDESLTNTPAQWKQFYDTLLGGLEQKLGQPVVIYWTGRNVWPLEYGFQHYPQQIRPYNFVLDTMQPQFGHSEVTWNVNYDNLGVQRTYKGFLRVIRNDPRYLQEMLWLAKNTQPDLVFIYSWNEFYEGANIMPDETYGDTRYKLVQSMIKDVRDNERRTLPRTLLITDDYSANWAKQDWHMAAEESAVIFPLRRYIPQADYKLATEVKPADLDNYDLIVSMQTSNPQLDDWLSKLIDKKKVVFYHPLPAGVQTVSNYFATSVSYDARNYQLHLFDAAGNKLDQVLARDDIMDVQLKSDSKVLVYALSKGNKIPVLIQRNDDYWVNYFWPDEAVFAQLFSSIYGRPLEQAILFGDGIHAQRLEVSADGKVVQNTFSASAVYQHEALPILFTSPPAEMPSGSNK